MRREAEQKGSKMDMLEIKATVRRSNPQIVRQIRMGTGCTAEELGQIVCASMGLDAQMPVSLSRAGQKLDGAAVLKELLPEKDSLELSFGAEPEWTVLIDIQPVSEDRADAAAGSDELFLPTVTRYRGYQPDAGCKTAADLNSFQSGLAYQEYYWNRGKEESKKHEFSEKKFEQRMRRLFAPDTVSKVIDHSLGMPLAELLNYWRVADLKKMISKKGLDIWTGQNKKALIEDMVIEMTRESSLKGLFQEMEAWEYRNFQKLCYDEEARFQEGLYALPMLGAYGMTAQRSTGEYLVAEELLDFYETWNGTEEEKNMAVLRRVRTCILAGCRLYAVLSREQAERIYGKCYPETYTKSGFLAGWKYYLQKTNTPVEISILNPSTVYDDISISRREAAVWINEALLEQAKWYLPDREEAERIAAFGNRFSWENEKKLDAFLERQIGCRNEETRDFLIEQIYHACHIHGDTDSIVNYIFQSVRMRRTGRLAAALGRLINQCRSEVREAGLYGYTDREFAEVLHG